MPKLSDQTCGASKAIQLVTIFSGLFVLGNFRIDTIRGGLSKLTILLAQEPTSQTVSPCICRKHVYEKGVDETGCPRMIVKCSNVGIPGWHLASILR